MSEPLWKDYYVDLGEPDTGSAGVPFEIYCVPKGETIFSGTAYPKPGETDAIVRINDICADYIAHYFLEQEDSTMPSVATFRVRSSGVQVAEVEFRNDWSYDPDYDPDRDGYNFPIIPTFAAGQLIPVTPVSPTAKAIIYLADGTVTEYVPTNARGADFNNDYNDDFLIAMEYFGSTAVIPMTNFATAVRVDYGGKTWLLSKHCPRHVLYYLNAYGGWDALPVEGKTDRSDALVRHNTGLVYDNGTTSARGRRNFINEVTPTFGFWTGWLSSNQADRMHHLLNSPNVYVHDLESMRVWPLVLTGSQTEYKGTTGKLSAYRIEAELARYRIRR